MEIQRKISKQGKRHAISRFVHAKSDKETIASWRMDLDRILHVFNVRSNIFVWLPLTDLAQTELSVNTHATVSDIHRDVAKTHAIVSEIRQDVTNTQIVVSGIHHNMLESRERADDHRRPVSDICVPPTVEQSLTAA